MKIEDGTVVFKSEPCFFKKERDGFKPNTVRLLTHIEKRQIALIKKIQIECTADCSLEPFTRTLTSIEQIGELCGFYLFVFSWRHEEEGQQ